MNLENYIEQTIKKHGLDCERILKGYFVIGDNEKEAQEVWDNYYKNKKNIEEKTKTNEIINPFIFSRLEIDGKLTRKYVYTKARVIRDMELALNAKLQNYGIRKLISMYSNYYNNKKHNIIKNVQTLIGKQPSDMRTLVEMVKKLSLHKPINQVKIELINTVFNNSSLMEVVDEVENFMEQFAINVYQDKYDRFIQFATSNYYEIYLDNKQERFITRVIKKVDNVLKLNVDDNRKAFMIYNLMEGNDTEYLDMLSEPVEQKDAILAVLSNAMRAGVANTDNYNRNPELYKGLTAKEIMNKSIKLYEIINNIAGFDIQKGLSQFSANQIKENFDNLSPEDKYFLCELYVINSKYGREIINKADKIKYNEAKYELKPGSIEEFSYKLANQKSTTNYYSNVSSLLKVVESSEFSSIINNNGPTY